MTLRLHQAHNIPANAPQLWPGKVSPFGTVCPNGDQCVDLRGEAAQRRRVCCEEHRNQSLFIGGCRRLFLPGEGVSNMAMAMLLQKRMKLEETTVHGFRSSFRDWAGESTGFPRELAEAALAHIVGNEVERAYRRGDALEKRRELMDAWERFVTSTQTANVLPMVRPVAT
ncbi:tyrosine-type recombinase/integrase [Ancylobacter sonchi]|uniref:tyrosine-type recombinase/integrase n=1 Tax=Ancylobacter sonchi TaxID=1937790 RepID=UPI0035E46774